MKSFELRKSDFEFNHLDESSEFREYIDFVFESKNTIFFVFEKGFTNTNPEVHIKEYYKSRSSKKVKFLRQL
jgi:hypothetical protein